MRSLARPAAISAAKVESKSVFTSSASTGFRVSSHSQYRECMRRRSAVIDQSYSATSHRVGRGHAMTGFGAIWYALMELTPFKEELEVRRRGNEKFGSIK